MNPTVLWADWQTAQKQANPEGALHYVPLQAGPPGHNFGDVLKPWSRRIQDVMDIAALGYSYETPVVTVMADVVHIPFAPRQSPFWAD